MKKQERNAVLILVVAWFLGLLICGGCRQPVANYTIQTRCPDIWDQSPKQEISMKMEFRR